MYTRRIIMSKKSKYLSNTELSAFCEQLSLVITAGLPTYYGVSILSDEAPDAETHDLLEKIYKPMELGQPLHVSLKEAGVFPPYMLHMIQLGEETGRLEEVLKSLSAYYEREEEIRSGIKSAVTYPLVLTGLMLVVILVMTTKVLPVFSQIYTELGSELTGTAALLMKISNMINHYMAYIILLIILLVVLCIVFFNTNSGKKYILGQKIPMSIAASRFANCMFLALSSGLDTDKGLDLADELVSNPHMSNKISTCRDDISHGSSFSSALLRSGIFSKMYSSWIAIGNKTGSMDEIMNHICKAYEEETDNKLAHFISVLEPALIIILCIFIGLILVSFLLPLLGIISSIG